MVSLLNDRAPAPATAAAPAASAAAAGLAPAALPPAGLDILIADDEPQVGRVIAHSVEAWGSGARLALSAAAFRTAFDDAAPDIVILDLSLPAGDGIELLRFLAEREARCAIVIVSGCDSRVVEAAGRLGCALGLRIAATLPKPVAAAALAAALAAAAGPAAQGGSSDLCL